MADAHEHGDFLLKTIYFGLLSRPSTRLEFLHGVPNATVLLHAQVDGGEMTLAQLLLYSVLLSEAIGIAVRRVSKYEASLIEYTYFIALLQFASLVATNNSIVHVSAIAGQVLQDGNRIATLVFGKQQAVSVRDGGRL